MLPELIVNEPTDVARFEQEGIHNFVTSYPRIPDEIRRELQVINPLRHSNSYGKDIFSEILQILLT